MKPDDPATREENPTTWEESLGLTIASLTPATREEKWADVRFAHARYAGGKVGQTFASVTSPGENTKMEYSARSKIQSAINPLYVNI